eukprot:scaffold29419_cov101-Isochrysis_galbana.AAC.4
MSGAAAPVAPASTPPLEPRRERTSSCSCPSCRTSSVSPSPCGRRCVSTSSSACSKSRSPIQPAPASSRWRKAFCMPGVRSYSAVRMPCEKLDRTPAVTGGLGPAATPPGALTGAPALAL